MSLGIAAAASAATVMAPRQEPKVWEATPPSPPLSHRRSGSSVGTTASRPRVRAPVEAPEGSELDDVPTCPSVESWAPSPETLRREAKEFVEAPGTTAQQGLAKYAGAEDLIRKSLVDAKQRKSPDEASYTETYKALLQESDEYSKRVITPQFIESVPWKDLLDAEMARKWSKTTTVPGFGCRIEGGVLTVTPPDEGTKMQGVCGVLDQKFENVRHLMLDMEFTVEGTATVYFHAAPPPANPDNRQSPTYDLSSKNGGLRPNELYSMVATFIGSDLAIWFPHTDEILRWENSPSWVQLRRGGIVFLIPEGTRLRVNRMRIRELR